MELAKVDLGNGIVVDASASNGNLVVTLTVPVKNEVDSLLDAAKAQVPAALAPLLDMLKAGADSALA